MLRVPVWDNIWTKEVTSSIFLDQEDDDEEEEDELDGFIALGESGWKQSSCVFIGDDADKKTLKEAKKSRHCIEQLQFGQHFEVAEAFEFVESSCRNLKVLQFADGIQCNSIGLNDLPLLAKALKTTTNLEQLYLHVHAYDAEKGSLFYKPLLASMIALPLRALYVHVESSELLHAEDFIHFARTKRELESLELFLEGIFQPLDAFDIAWAEFFRSVVENGSRLCVLRTSTPCLSQKSLDLLAQSLPRMTVLSTLGFSCETGVSIEKLAQCFSSVKNSPIRVLEMEWSPITEPDVLSFIGSLHNLRLERICMVNCEQLLMNNLVSTRLADLGWLVDVRTDYSTYEHEQSLQPLILRNRKRHERCRCTAAALIALRKKKYALTMIPLDVVVLVAKNLLDLRNDATWDEEAKKSQKKKGKKK